DEIVYVSGPESGLQSGVDVRGRNTERVGLLFVQIDFQLRGIFQTLHPHANNHRTFRGHCQKLISRGQTFVVTESREVFQLEVESGRVAQFIDGRWIQRKNNRVLDRGKL